MVSSADGTQMAKAAAREVARKENFKRKARTESTRGTRGKRELGGCSRYAQKEQKGSQ